MKAVIHSKNSVKLFGGKIEDYIKLHTWMDSTKSSTAKFYHRAILHSAFGIFLGEQVFGEYLTNSDGDIVSVRDILEQHVKEDCVGKIPSIDDWLKDLPMQPWMVGKGMKKYIEEQGLHYE